MKTALICDDAIFMRVSIQNYLLKAGYNIIGEAVNGIEAVAKYKALKPDLVTMDITMPEMDGVQATRAIKEFDNNAKILMISAMGQEAYVVESIKAGAKGFVIKPFTEESILEALNKLG